MNNPVYLYRLIILNEINQLITDSPLGDTSTYLNAKGQQIEEGGGHMNLVSGDIQDIHSSDDSKNGFDLSSVSSTASTNAENSFNKMIKDFKVALGVRKTPGKLIYLNRLIMVIVLVFLIITSAEYIYKESLMPVVINESQHSLATTSRNIMTQQLLNNIRTLINIANNLEDNFYSGDLSKINRF